MLVVSVRPDRSAAHRGSAIVSANDSGHYGFLDCASYKAALDRRREAVDLFSDDGIGHIERCSCPGLCSTLAMTRRGRARDRDLVIWWKSP